MSTAVRNQLGTFVQALVLPLLASLACVAPAAAQEVVADPPSRVARLSHTDGEVVIAPAGTEEWAEAVLNRPLTTGDRLWTESGSRAELQIGSAAAYLDERTSFSFVELDDDVMQMSLTEGAATIRIRRLSEDESVQVETPNVAVALKEPGEYHIEVDAQSDRTIVKTRHGAAEVFGGEVTHVVRSDERGTFVGLEQLSAQVEPLGTRTAFENWANDRERRHERARSAQYVSRDVIGYEDLDDHGDWYHEPEYGYVWRPRYIAYDWAPYRDGRWVWVSPWGWTWVDHARWGFAPFHYGRWAHVRDRWCWVPGPRHYRPVYAPALVGWVGRPHVGVSVSFGSGIGWFPLGPHEVYIPGYRHSPRYIRHVNVSNTIIVNNTYITNVYTGRHRDFDYRYSRHARAITAVDRGHFISGRPVLGRVMRVNEQELQNWRPEHRPPALAPDRASVLAGSIRRAPPLRRSPDQTISGVAARRVAFDTERRHIEANGGRPIGRTELYGGIPKERGDFNPRGLRTERSGVSRGAPRVSTQDSGVRGFAQGGQRIQTLPARENSGAARESAERVHRGEPRTLENRASENVAGGLRQSDRPMRVAEPNVSRESSRPRSSSGSAPDTELRQSIPRRESAEPRIHSAPEIRNRFDSHRSAPAPRVSEPRVESRSNHSERRTMPSNPVEHRAAPQQPSRASSDSSSQPRSHSAPRHDGGSRSNSRGSGNYRER